MPQLRIAGGCHGRWTAGDLFSKKQEPEGLWLAIQSGGRELLSMPILWNQGKGSDSVGRCTMSNEPQSLFLLYQTSDGQTRLEVRLENETVWLSQNQMAELFQTSIPNVSMHIRNVFAEGELQPGATVKNFLTTAADGKNYKTSFYNLDVIISVGYRVKSHRGTQFRISATQRLREYIVKGFTLDDQRLKRA